jgi:protein-L-isoaspartate(D-aspartate) O-methyltransferase
MMKLMDAGLPSSYFGEEDDDPSRRIRLLMKLRTAGIQDTAVLSAMESTPREKFVTEAFAQHAYDDTALPIACGQTISQPTVVAWMTAALSLNDRHTVLEIGTGCGYQTAILSRLARRVYSIERHRELMDAAKQRFDELGFTNIVTRTGDGSKGWREAAPFDRILVTAAASEIPEVLLAQLRVGGVAVIPVGAENGNQVLLRIHKDENGELHTQHLMPVRFVPLVTG